jgi:DNA-binding NarL/FixJ family response regulator
MVRCGTLNNYLETKVLMLMASMTRPTCTGYLLKDKAPATVVKAIRAVMGGGTWFSQKVVEKLARPREMPALTRREQEVLRLVASGKSNQQIAEELHVAEVTARFHLRNIYDKVGVHTRGEAIHWAMQQGLAEDLS